METRLTAIVEREGEGYVALCPEVDVASQGGTVFEARDNLIEALTLFFETASAEEINRRLRAPAPCLGGKAFCLPLRSSA